MAPPAPALQCARSRPIPGKTTEEQYHHFYNVENMPAYISYPSPLAPKMGLRYRNVDTSGTDWPYLAIYPANLSMPMVTRAMAEVRSRGSETFGGAPCQEYIAFEHRGFRRLNVYEDRSRDSDEDGMAYYSGPAQTLIIDSVDSAGSTDVRMRSDFNTVYQPPRCMQQCEAYRRTVTFKLTHGKAPRFMALHEFECEASELSEDVRRGGEGELDGAREVMELIFACGDTMQEL